MTTNKENEEIVEIPREWLERLISLSDAILSTSQNIGNEGKSQLLGYIESAKYLLDKKTK